MGVRGAEERDDSAITGGPVTCVRSGGRSRTGSTGARGAGGAGATTTGFDGGAARGGTMMIGCRVTGADGGAAAMGALTGRSGWRDAAGTEGSGRVTASTIARIGSGTSLGAGVVGVAGAVGVTIGAGCTGGPNGIGGDALGPPKPPDGGFGGLG